jgi:hypothetical protein
MGPKRLKLLRDLLGEAPAGLGEEFLRPEASK